MAPVSRVGGRALAALLPDVHTLPGPVYTALSDGITALILDGRIATETRLPSERELAVALQLSRATVTAAYDALRAGGYLASRTAWRGVRFQLRGSASSFGWTFLGYGALSGVSLGWFWPAADRRLAGRLWGALSFGDHPLEFRIEEARKEKVYPAYALGWVGGIVGYAVFMSIIFGMLAPQMRQGASPAPPDLHEIGVIYVAAFVLAIFYAVAFAPFHAAMLRSVAAGIGFGEVRFKLRLRWTELAGLTLVNIGLLIVSLGLLLPFIEARTRKFLLDRLESSGTTDLDVIGQAPNSGPRTGEGLADAFGIATI